MKKSQILKARNMTPTELLKAGFTIDELLENNIISRKYYPPGGENTYFDGMDFFDDDLEQLPHPEEIEINTECNYNEAHDTVKEFCRLSGIKEGDRSWLEFSTDRIDDDVLNLSGLRLRKWILNNWTWLYKSKYIGHISKPIKHKRIKVKNTFFPYYSGCQVENSCVLTGVCWDDSLLSPVYDFIAFKGNYKDTNLDDLLSDCFYSLKKDLEQ